MWKKQNWITTVSVILLVCWGILSISSFENLRQTASRKAGSVTTKIVQKQQYTSNLLHFLLQKFRTFSSIGCDFPEVTTLNETTTNHRFFYDSSLCNSTVNTLWSPALNDEILWKQEVIFVDISPHLKPTQIVQRTLLKTLQKASNTTTRIVLYNESLCYSKFSSSGVLRVVTNQIDEFFGANLRWYIQEEVFEITQHTPHLFILVGSTNAAFGKMQKLQFPQDCTKTRFLVVPIWQAGLGSYIFVNSIGMAASSVFSRF